MRMPHVQRQHLQAHEWIRHSFCCRHQRRCRLFGHIKWNEFQFMSSISYEQWKFSVWNAFASSLYHWVVRFIPLFDRMHATFRNNTHTHTFGLFRFDALCVNAMLNIGMFASMNRLHRCIHIFGVFGFIFDSYSLFASIHEMRAHFLCLSLTKSIDLFLTPSAFHVATCIRHRTIWQMIFHRAITKHFLSSGSIFIRINRSNASVSSYFCSIYNIFFCLSCIPNRITWLGVGSSLFSV